MVETLQHLLTVILHTFVLYLFIILALSFIGHRQTSQLGIVELVVVMVLGSSVETAMVAGNTSLLAGFASAGTLLISNRLFSLIINRWIGLRRFVIGQPIPLVARGRYILPRIHQAGLSEDDVLEGIRERGYESVDQVRLAVLEIDGSISVVPNEPLGGKNGI
ncbi:MAG: DUF421 domain-containing protein [Omnitrophica WOR_2 bacterium]